MYRHSSGLLVNLLIKCRYIRSADLVASDAGSAIKPVSSCMWPEPGRIAAVLPARFTSFAELLPNYSYPTYAGWS